MLNFIVFHDLKKVKQNRQIFLHIEMCKKNILAARQDIGIEEVLTTTFELVISEKFTLKPSPSSHLGFYSLGVVLSSGNQKAPWGRADQATTWFLKFSEWQPIVNKEVYLLFIVIVIYYKE